MLSGQAPSIWVALEPTDMRFGIDGLCAKVQHILSQDPFGGAWYVFRNKAGNRLKILVYDGLGFWLHYRRLDQGSFVWPKGRHSGPRNIVTPKHRSSAEP